MLFSVKLTNRDKATHIRLKKCIEDTLDIDLDNADHMNKVIANVSSDSLDSNSDFSSSDFSSENDEDDDEEDYDIRYYKRRKEKKLEVIEEEESRP